MIEYILGFLTVAVIAMITNLLGCTYLAYAVNNDFTLWHISSGIVLIGYVCLSFAEFLLEKIIDR